MNPQPAPVPPVPLSERLRTPMARRATGLVAALLLEALLLLLLLSLGRTDGPRGERPTLVSFEASPEAEPAPEPEASPEPEPAPRADERPTPSLEPLPPRLAEPAAPPAVVLPRETAAPTEPPPRPATPATRLGPAQGPPDRRSAASAAYADTERVGTAPNGEPLYAAAWYREPYDDELRGYLSTAQGPGWGLIACRTVPDYRVADCVGLDEYPRGSMIMRSVLAAAWQFRVRPPRLGGRVMVGEWVRIRIDYEIRREAR